MVDAPELSVKRVLVENEPAKDGNLLMVRVKAGRFSKPSFPSTVGVEAFPSIFFVDEDEAKASLLKTVEARIMDTAESLSLLDGSLIRSFKDDKEGFCSSGWQEAARKLSELSQSMTLLTAKAHRLARELGKASKVGTSEWEGTPAQVDAGGLQTKVESGN